MNFLQAELNPATFMLNVTGHSDGLERLPNKH